MHSPRLFALTLGALTLAGVASRTRSRPGRFTPFLGRVTMPAARASAADRR